MSGGAIDLSGSTDPRAHELERRIVLSQYLTRIQCAGSLPPKETGLAFNSWYGKFHLEMHWWHGVHFALWDRLGLLEKSMGWYDQILNSTKATAQWQGFAGVRWPKMADPYGMLPLSPMIDTAVMANTFREVMRDWNWLRTRGWDYPMPAMTAACLNRPEAAIDALLLDVQKNTYLVNGHTNFSTPQQPAPYFSRVL